MTEPTPPTDRDDDFAAGAEADFDAILSLVHASIDDELTAEEEESIEPDETWRTRVSEARKAVDAVQTALPLPPVDENRREAHLITALATFDEIHGTGDDISIPPPASQQNPTPDGPPPSSGTDDLAHRRNAKAWLRRAPIGIAAAVLAAVVVVGATQFTDDGSEETASVPDSDSSADDSADDSAGDVLTEAGGVADGEDESGERLAPTAGQSAETSTDAEQDSALTRADAQFYSLSRAPGSLDTFVDSVSAMVGGDMHGVDISDDLDLGPMCDRQQAVRLAATPDQEDDLLWVRAVLEGRAIVGVIDRTDPSQVTIIDLDRCAVIAVQQL